MIIPAKAGIQGALDSRLRGNDGSVAVRRSTQKTSRKNSNGYR